jgi:hypothetical protein
MPVMLVLDAPGMTRDQYESLRPLVRWESEHPDGALLHCCAFDENGGVHVVDIWESREKPDAFFGTRLMPVMQEKGIEMPQPSVYEVYNVDAFPGIEKHTP